MPGHRIWFKRCGHFRGLPAIEKFQMVGGNVLVVFSPMSTVDTHLKMIVP